MPFIRETILTTIGPGGVHIAPLGIIADGDGWIVAPFRPSTTLDNLRKSGVTVANLTDDARIFAGCVTGRRIWPLAAVEGCPAPRLEAALAHEVLALDRVTGEDGERPRFHCRVASSGRHRPFGGMNRARAAIVEGAILVSRLHLLPADKIRREAAYLAIAVEKTAGDDEREAWSWLTAAIEAHLSGDRDGIKT